MVRVARCSLAGCSLLPSVDQLNKILEILGTSVSVHRVSRFLMKAGTPSNEVLKRVASERVGVRHLQIGRLQELCNRPKRTCAHCPYGRKYPSKNTFLMPIPKVTFFTSPPALVLNMEPPAQRLTFWIRCLASIPPLASASHRPSRIHGSQHTMT